MGQFKSILSFFEGGDRDDDDDSFDYVEVIGDNPSLPQRKKRRKELDEHRSSRQTKLFDYCLKIIIIGDSNCGKTCILKRFQTSNFPIEQAHTVGVEFGSKIVQIGDKRIKLQLWDTAGQERYRSVTRSYYNGAAGAILVYNICDRNSFENVNNWVQDVKDLAPSAACIAICGNKKDLEDQRQISFMQGSECAQKYGALFFETSAVTGECIQEVFLNLAKQILPKVEANLNDRANLQDESVKVVEARDLDDSVPCVC